MERFQLLPPLDDGARAALRADIELHGVQVPVLVRGDGEIVDGHNRFEIAEELGVHCPTALFRGDDDEAAEAALRLNLLRRHLGPVAWAHAFRQLAERRGIRIGQGARNDRTSATVAEVGDSKTLADFRTVAQGKGVGVLARELGVPPRTARRRLRLAAALEDHPDLAAKVDSGEIDARKAAEQIRIANWRKRAEQAPPPPVVSVEDGIEIRLGDFREVLADIPDQSVDAIVCDPPYDDAGVPVFSDLSAFAARVLKPGRLLAAYCGKSDLLAQLNRLNEHLEYMWLGAVFLPGRHVVMRSICVRGRWRPVALFSSGKYESRHWIIDASAAEGAGVKGPTDHRWQQATGPIARWVEQLAEPGELVCDPFVGSGTTALACQQTGRRFLGCDVEAASVSLTLERLKAAAA
jgi:hypothetical protein